MRAETLGRGGALGALLLLVMAAPVWATTANDLCAANADPCVVATPVPVTHMSLIDVGTRELRINSGGALDVGGGTMTIRAGRLTVNTNGFIRASGTSAATAGTLNIEVAGPATINGSLDARGAPGGTINLTSTGDVVIGGNTTTPGITARALSTSEVGGTINVRGATVNLTGAMSVLGGFDALGGDVAITATGLVTLNGSIDTTGGDGGSIDVEAGAAPGPGDVVVGNAAMLKVDATLAGGFGGTLDLVARGDGVEHGHITVDGVLTATGKTGGEDTGGGAGGCITLGADGNIRSTRTAASINASGGGPDGDGGEVELTSNKGFIELNGSADAGSAGIESSGGSVTVDAFGDVIINGLLTAVGGDGGGGEVDLASDTANITVSRTSTIDVDSTAAGTGGAIAVDSGIGAPGTPRSVLIEGTLSASGGASGGGGGTIELQATDAVRVASTASLHADGALGGGPGGAISVDVGSGPALIDGPMTAAGGNPNGAGGLISIDASQRIVLTAVTDARGFGVGGEIGLASTGSIDVRGNLLTGSSTAGGGHIEIVSDGDVMIASQLIADGVALPAAQIDVTGCTINVCGLDSPDCPSGGTGILSSLGPEGRNRITGRDATGVFGVLRANSNSGHNILLYNGDPESEPFIRLGTVTPAGEVTINDQILPCPKCGNDNIEAPETCDDGNELDGDGCSADCQVEAPIPGDANGDYDLTPADREFAVTEIFDGDGDTVGTVSGGTFAGGVGVDANDDGFVTAADLVGITRLLAP